MAEEKTAEIILLRDYKRKKEEAEHKAAYDALSPKPNWKINAYSYNSKRLRTTG